MPEDQILKEFNLLQRHTGCIQSEMKSLLKAKDVCMLTFSQLQKGKPTLRKAQEFYNRIKQIEEGGEVKMKSLEML